MKPLMKSKIDQALRSLFAKENIDVPAEGLNFAVEEPRDPNHGQLATNAAMALAKVFRKKPRELAEMIMAEIDNSDGYLQAMEPAGPGFINFTFSLKWWGQVLRRILAEGDDFGRGAAGGRKVQVEYVSANPTGPLHVGHGRGAAIGDALARVMEFAGYEVSREYYINDAGRQMNILGASVLARLRELAGSAEAFPENHYRGEYIKDIAKGIWEKEGRAALEGPEDALVARLTGLAKDVILQGIKADLASFRVRHDVWFSESSLYADGQVQKALDFMRGRGHLYEEDGALWFRSEPLGDDKNRVLIKSNGEQTYFSADIAYHWNKFQRGFELLVDVWGADHHGYIPRMKAAIEALGYDRDQLAVVLVQLVNLLRDGQPVAMSTRAGEFVTLREVLDEVGADAARFIFLTRSSDSSLDFDLELAKAKSKDNPVYYVQYVSARISSILAASGEPEGACDFSLLAEPEEAALMKKMAIFPEVVKSAADRREPHHVAAYLTDLAKLFHHYYGRHKIACEDRALALARLTLAKALRQVVRRGLDLLGVNAPTSM